MSDYSKRVYSTETGSNCLRCGKRLKACECKKQNQGAAGHQHAGGEATKVKVSRESKGRKGSGVSLISGLPLSEQELKKLAKTLKRLCGSGGAVKNGVIEIQGEHRDRLVEELGKLGYKVVKAGG